ncbi:hypothetical protein F3Y22_tig00005929pilonHSYRG00139 [Hibiscus syriacus]|uniref:Uncharacterized protein n=1 Tax=Hibiscus syriacus TaxID=106335 RepID=A0A6A3CD04_HIBSY|nr:hypothetical protein F3Y22_tig00005929pilonHSYRG00139 [Hibiscus syriacus]
MYCDVTKEQDIGSLVQSTIRLHGRLGIMFCNAGVLSQSMKTILEFDLSSYEKFFAVNVGEVAASIEYAGQAMVKANSRGSIICKASIAAGLASDRNTDYVMSKSLVVALMRCASSQLAPHVIHVKIISPGPVATSALCATLGMGADDIESMFLRMFRLKNDGVLKVKHVADAAVFLATNSANSPMSNKLEGKVAIVTGGASGIGEATARHFAVHGIRMMVIADIQDELGQKVMESIGSHKCSYKHCDVADEEQVKNLVHSTVQNHGRLDIMFSNAGIVSNTTQTILELDFAEFDRIFAVNARGMGACVKHAARAMVELKIRGSIVCTASTSASSGSERFTDYCVSKHALVGLVNRQANSLGCMGLGLKGVTLDTKHIADAVLFLASQDSDLITGHDLVVDAGFLVR